nr:Na+/H+ antiporter subunit E [Microbacterium amylolyticum]
MTWPFRLIGYVFWFAGQLVSSNWKVLHDNLTPGQGTQNGIARMPTKCRTDLELTLLASCITLTPGTLTIGTDTTGDGTRVLFVHGMYADSPDVLRAELQVMQNRLLRALRRKGLNA